MLYVIGQQNELTLLSSYTLFIGEFIGKVQDHKNQFC